jgi:hypothetical protein
LGYSFLVVTAIYLSSVFASFRSDPIFFLSGNMGALFSPSNILDVKGDQYISHHGDVVHSSSRLMNFADNNLVTVDTRLASFFYFISSGFIPQKYLPPESNLAAYMKDDYPTGGGGNLFAYFYFWFSYPGVILISIVVGFLLAFYSNNTNSIFSPYFIIMMATFPRWMSYSPINLIKMCSYSLIVFFLFVLLHHTFSLLSNKFKA